jgi:CRISPR system Cascade subunit CasA
LPVDFCGLATDRAKLLFWRHERLPMPLAYLDEPELMHALRQALALAEGAAGALRSSARALAELLVSPSADSPNGRKPKREDTDRMLASLAPERTYWPRLELPFSALLVDLPGEGEESDDGDLQYGRTLLPAWAKTVRQAAQEAFNTTVDGLAGSPRTVKPVAKAEGAFRRALGTVLKDYPLELPEVPYAPGD